MPEIEVFLMSFPEIYPNYASGLESTKHFETQPVCFPCRGRVVTEK